MGLLNRREIMANFKNGLITDEQADEQFAALEVQTKLLDSMSVSARGLVVVGEMRSKIALDEVAEVKAIFELIEHFAAEQNAKPKTAPEASPAVNTLTLTQAEATVEPEATTAPASEVNDPSPVKVDALPEATAEVSHKRSKKVA